MADERIHGTTHQRPLERFKDEAAALMPTAGQPSYRRPPPARAPWRPGDWLVSIEGNRYSVPFALIGKTVQVVREGGHWVVRHRGQVVAQHPMLTGRAQMSVHPGHGPGAVARNARKRYADLAELPAFNEPVMDAGREVQVRELAIYDQLLEAA